MINLHDALKHAQVESSLIETLHTLTASCKHIQTKLRGGALGEIYGNEDTQNVQGEVQKKLDVIANTLLKKNLLSNRNVAGIASEEEAEPIPGNDTGQYLVAFDPLDGSSNIDINVSVGTIFSILRTHTLGSRVSALDFLQPGHQQVAAGYVLYGPATCLVLTTGKGVSSYELNYDGDFYLIDNHLTLPETTQEFAINMSNQRFWQAPMQAYVDDLLLGDTGPLNKHYNMRWVASMVAEVHRIITRGGIFMYPWDSRNPNLPGKLRLMYEGNPMSFIIEQAGGASSNTQQRMMDIQPQAIHERVAVILGAREEVERVNVYHRG